MKNQTASLGIGHCRQCERAPHESLVARESTNVRDVKLSDDDVFSVPRAFSLRTNTITENSHTTQTTIFTFLHLQLSHSAIVMLFNSRLCQIALSISGPSLCFLLGEQTFVDSVAASLSLCVMGRQYWERKVVVCLDHTHTLRTLPHTHDSCGACVNIHQNRCERQWFVTKIAQKELTSMRKPWMIRR